MVSINGAGMRFNHQFIGKISNSVMFEALIDVAVIPSGEMCSKPEGGNHGDLKIEINRAD